MSTPYQDATSQQNSPYTYTPTMNPPSSQFATPDPSQYASTSTQPATQPTQTLSSSTAASTSQPQQAKQSAEEARKDKTLAEFLLMLDDYEPLVRRQ